MKNYLSYNQKFDLKDLSKKGTRFFLVSVLVLSLITCAVASDHVSTNQDTRTITDMSGRIVQIPTQIEKIAIVPIPWTSVVYAVDGSEKKIVGMNPSVKDTLNSTMLGEMAPGLYSVSSDFTSSDFTVNIEELLKIKPDVIIQWNEKKLKEGEFAKLESVGIPVVTLTYGTTKDLEGGIHLIGTLLGKEERAKEFTDNINETMDTLSTRVATIKDEDKPSVFYLQDEKLKTFGKDSYDDFAIEKTGGKNVAHDLAGQTANANMEQILAWNPEIIYISNFCTVQPSDILENRLKGQDWSGIKAVKEGKVFKVPQGLYRWDAPSTESPLFLKWLAQTQHPEIFNDYSMVDEVQKFYQKFFNYQLSDEKARKILNLN